MLMMFNYLKIKQSWFLFVYFVFLFSFSSFDFTGIMPSIIYSLGLYIICENTQVFFDFDHDKDNCIVELLHQLPIKKRAYQMFITLFNVSFVIISTLISFLTMSVNYQLFQGELIFFVMNWLYISMSYLLFHLWETWILKSNINVSKYRKYLLIASMLTCFINPLYISNGAAYNLNKNKLMNQMLFFGIFVVGAGVFAFVDTRYKNSRNSPKNFKKSASKYSNIIKLSELTYSKGKDAVNAISFVWIIYLLFDFVGNYQNYEYLFSIYSIGLMTFFFLMDILSSVYSKNTFLKLVPFSRKDIFLVTFIKTILYVAITETLLQLAYFGLLLIKGEQFVFSITISSLLIGIALFISSLWITYYGYASRYYKFFYICLGVACWLVILGLGPKLLTLNTEGLILVIFIILGGILLLINFFKTGFKRLSYK
ncbi:hypothetical protein [Anaerorhabdus furcosa]|uniref:Uncharacterized protein n=1 Tax=Anaerorhabdus furcosa TaxID=118967 RepID=A0A1T4PJ43_9FIRM|nr:hypothetical protein [Anaerorhabdus furcosa]SJZ91519.1 hypothetical protein SAMN02745191_2061 [Anaerorhabdus furcosa]